MGWVVYEEDFFNLTSLGSHTQAEERREEEERKALCWNIFGSQPIPFIFNVDSREEIGVDTGSKKERGGSRKFVQARIYSWALVTPPPALPSKLTLLPLQTVEVGGGVSEHFL